MKDQILILTNKDDESIEPVIEQLKVIEAPFYRFNTETFPLETILGLGLYDGKVSGTLSDKNGVLLLDLGRIKSVWYRRPASAWINDERLTDGCAQFIKNEANTALWSLYTTLDVFWMNHPLISQRLLEHNKLYQLKDASSVGLCIPNTLITNNPDKLLQFCRNHKGMVAVKLLKGGWFVKDGSNVPLFVFTQKITEEEIKKRSDEIRLAPVLIQEYIEKKLELRITIVDKTIFTCAIHSQNIEQTKIDWRQYDFKNVKHETWRLPAEIEAKLLLLMKKWG
ncbi:MAG: MvdC/MvdD family ATP grasp protein, partial [Patescibacteria group bacterium]